MKTLNRIKSVLFLATVGPLAVLALGLQAIVSPAKAREILRNAIEVANAKK